MKTVKTNLNYNISFIPTPETYDIYNKYMDNIKVYGRGLMHMMKDDKVVMPMHQFMKIFGPHFGPCHSDMPIKDMNVEIEVKNE
jgi:hypothetical protein